VAVWGLVFEGVARPFARNYTLQMFGSSGLQTCTPGVRCHLELTEYAPSRTFRMKLFLTILLLGGASAGCLGCFASFPSQATQNPIAFFPSTPNYHPVTSVSPIPEMTAPEQAEILLENGSTIHSTVDGRYYWFYHAFTYGGTNHYHIRAASADSATGPWKAYPDPLLDIEGTDYASVACPSVIEQGAKFYMFYCAYSLQTSGLNWNIELAESENPLGPWKPLKEIFINAGYVTNIIADGSRFLMYYQSKAPINNDYGPTIVAQSSSITGPWAVASTALDVISEAWENAGTQSGTVLKLNGRYVMFYSGSYYIDSIRMHAHDSIGVAFSDDGIHFKRSHFNPIVSDVAISVGNNSALLDNGTIYLYYTHRTNLDTGWDCIESLGEVSLHIIPSY
jgi:hypothetical protein